MAEKMEPRRAGDATGEEKPCDAIASGLSSIAERRTPRQHHETADCCWGIVARLCGDWRVIVCRDALQWILQRRKDQRGGQARWAAVRYLPTRDALLRASHLFCGRIDPAALAVLAALPDRIGGAA